jgi:hypothetical protein
LIGQEEEADEEAVGEQDEEMKEGDHLEIHNVDKDAAKKRTCEVSTKAKLRKLKESIA